MQTTRILSTENLQFVDLRTVDEDMGRRLNDFWNVMRRERLPDDPIPPLEESLRGWHNLPDFEVNLVWAVWNPDHTEIIAILQVEFWKTEDNQHLLFFEIYVDKEQRRLGLGRELLRLAVQTAQENSKRLMMTESNDHIPAGTAFMERLGAQRGMETHINQLRSEDLNLPAMQRWQDNTSGRFDAFQLGLWDGAYPEEQIEGVLELFKIANDEPHDDLEIEDRIFTREQLRQMEQQQQARGTQRWTIYVTEKATGRFCGFTEVFWNPNRPMILQQGFTGVNPDFRGKNLGRYMKAVMMEKVLAERPQVTMIRTGNANSNRFMLAINDEMGFKPYLAWTVWQIETEKALAYLG